MSLSPAAMVLAANALRTALGAAQLHTDNPGNGAAANKSSAGMVAPAWLTPDANGNFDLAVAMQFSGATPNGPITWVSLWSNSTGSGIWYGNFQLSGDLTADSNGNYTVESLTMTAVTS
jgi:hypothetical protein